MGIKRELKLSMETEYTEQQIEETREKLRDYLEENKENKNVSQNKIARAIGYSAASISTFLNNEFKGDIQKLIKHLADFFDRERENQIQPREKIQFVQTKNAKLAWGLAEYARKEKTICVLFGPPGSGKTFALQEYKENKTKTTFIEATLSIEAKTLLEMLHKELGLTGLGRIHNLLMDVVEKVKDTNHLFIFDEAEYFPYRTIEHVRRLADFANVGVLLSGTKRLKDNIIGRRGEHVQLWSRVANWQQLGPLTNVEAKLIIEQNLPGINGLWEIVYSYTKKNARVLGHLIKLIKFRARMTGSQIDEELIILAANQLIINNMD